MVNAKLTSVVTSFSRCLWPFTDKRCLPSWKSRRKIRVRFVDNQEDVMAKKKSAATAPKATYRIEWWVSKKDGDYYAAATCVENGQEVWRQSEGIKRRIDMMTVIDRLFLGLWPVTKLKATTTKD